jgi:uncharacterized membrane protein YdjX (TVP38/TMEM64 family)
MKVRRILSLVAFPAAFAAILTLGIVFRREIWTLFTSSERLRTWIAAAGLKAPLLFVGVQALQVVVFFIPGEIPQIVGGFLFGVWQGALLSLAGITLGACFNFLMARLLGVPFVRALFANKDVERVRRLAESGRARLTFFLLFLIPGIPKDILCYAAGLSSLSLGTFLLFSSLGRLPGIVGSAAMGDAAAGERWLLAGSLMLLAVGLFVAGFLLRDRLQALLARLARWRGTPRESRRRAGREPTREPVRRAGRPVRRGRPSARGARKPRPPRREPPPAGPARSGSAGT